MPEGAFHQPRKGSPTALTIVVLMHGAAIGALALSKIDVESIVRQGPTVVTSIPVPPPPPPPPVEDPPLKVELPRAPSVPFVPPPIVPTPPTQIDLSTTTKFDPLPPIVRAPVADVPVLPAPPPPQPAPPKKVEAARAKANLASYVSNDDYPAAALRSEDEGTTRFRLTVAPDGRVSACTVTQTSGSRVLDEATCRIMQRRARFTPARGSDGKPTTDTVSSAIRWELPD
ncbi:MAG: energy transducer TonB [Allosphingosinicella sp.]